MTCSYKQNQTVQYNEVLCWLCLASAESLKVFPPLPLFLKIFQGKKSKLFWSSFSRNQQTLICISTE